MITEKDVMDWADLDPAPGSNTEHAIKQVVPAVNAYVDSLPGIGVTTDADGSQIWDERTRLGAVMLASRWVRRKDSANGIESITDAGSVYVTKYDADIARLLNVDSFLKPAVG